MSDQYMKELLRVAVAQICQTIGYNATQSAPLELLQDVLDKFMREFTRDLRRQVEHYNRTEPNLNDVTLTLSSINVNLNELLDYINNVEPVPFALDVPKFPARKDSSLNFLKPGSKEVLTRPVHVHAHLPPMLPPEITQPVEPPVLAGSSSNTNLTDTKDNLTASTSSTNGEQPNETSTKSLNSSTVLDKSTLQSLFKPSTNFEDGERPTREVSSVVMTTGGYISPAVEGKMPEAIVPDIIDKLLGLDAPPPPPPPPAPPTQSRPASRSANSTPNPLNNDNLSTLAEKDAPERDMVPTTSKESKKQALARSLEPQPVTHKKTELLADLPNMKKHHKLFHPSGSKNFPPDLQPHPVGNFNKKSFMMHQNNPGALQTPQTNYANMLLKKAKKQKVPLMPGQPLNEKHSKPMADKMGKMDAADKAHRKYMKMLQKMAKQGKIPPELMSNIMGPDKKSKQINPAIVASMPPGPERVQLEKLLRKQAKQRQKMLKQQILMDVQKQSKKPQQQLPPLVPLFPPRMPGDLNKPLALEMEEQKLKMDSKDLANVSPVKPQFTPNLMANTPTSAGHQLTETLLNKSHKTPLANDTPALELMDSTGKPLLTADGKELKLSNEPDRSKLNIFKKISKQKTPKSSSPTPMRLTGINDTPLINLPSGTTITPAPGPSNPPNSSTPHSATPLSRNLFPPLNDNNASGLNSSNIINVDDIKDKPVASTPLPTTGQINPPQATDLSLLNRVFGEKPPDVELINKPKKRGRKPGSKNSPKIPGQFPNSMLKKASKKMKLDNSHLFPGQMPPQLPPDFGAGGGMGNLSFDNMAQMFGNPLNPMEWAQNKHLQQQMMIMAGAKERKEHKKKSKLLKQDLLNNDNNMASLNMTNPSSSMGVPTNEEVQSINKKLMRMDTILKAAPSSSSSTTDLSVDTSLITGKKLPSPAMFPSTGSSASSTSPLKSPGNSKRLMSGAEIMASSLVQPFMLPNRPAFPNLPSNMLSMLQFPFPPRPGLIPPPGLFPTPGLGAFPNNPKNPLLPGLFPFPNLKQPMGDSVGLNQDTEDLTTDKKKSDTNLQAAERSYCNVAPLVPDYLTKLNEQQQQHSGSGNKHSHDPSHEPDLPKTPKPRNSHSNTLTHDNLLKKMQDAHTPESGGGSISGKSIPSTPGGMSLNTFEQLMKKNESPVDLMALNKHNKSLSQSQESGLDFSMNKKSGGGSNMVGMSSAAGGLSIKTPITLNNEPIEVSDDSDETNQPPPPPPAKSQSTAPTHLPSQPSQVFAGSTHHSSFNMDDMFVANTSSSGSHMPQKSLDSDLSTKELKKLKKQVKKSSSSISSASLMGADKTEGLAGAGGQGSAGGVGKLAGGADLIPLTSTGMAYSSKNIPYNSLTANANPTFNAHKTDFTNNAGSSSGGTAPSSSSVFDNLTITAAIPSSSGASSSTVYDLQKKRKEHKKLKKLKELKDGKIKKKKDKKDKNKSKEKAEKYLLTHTQSSPVKEKEQQQQPTIEIIPTPVVPPPVIGHHNTTTTTTSSSASISNPEKIKDKDLLKKLKKEKKKEKLRTNLDDHHQQHHTTQNSSSLQQVPSISNPSTGSNKDLTTAASSSSSATGLLSLDIEPTKKQKLSPALLHPSSSGNEHNNETPSGGSATTTATAPAAIVPKLTLKLGSTHSPTPPRDDSHKNTTTTASSLSSAATVQTPAAVSSPPREHQREPSPELARISPLVTRPPKHKLNTSGELSASSTASNSISAANASSLELGDGGKTSSSSNPNMVVPPPSPWLSGGTISASSVLLPHQLLQTTKQHDITSTTAGGAAHHNTDAASKSASTDRQSPLTLITETSRPSSYIDAEGNRVWICPACGKVDDGSPMIGCDGCDAWYHWVCVGIFVAPKDNEDWFCRVCITRKKGLHGSDKKRKRNKKK